MVAITNYDTNIWDNSPFDRSDKVSLEGMLNQYNLNLIFKGELSYKVMLNQLDFAYCDVLYNENFQEIIAEESDYENISYSLYNVELLVDSKNIFVHPKHKNVYYVNINFSRDEVDIDKETINIMIHSSFFDVIEIKAENNMTKKELEEGLSKNCNVNKKPSILLKEYVKENGLKKEKIKVTVNLNRMKNASTYEERQDGSVKLYNEVFSKGEFKSLISSTFNINIDNIVLINGKYNYVRININGKYFNINIYYFDVINDKPKENKKEKKMKDMQGMVNELADVNKRNAKQAARIKAGKIANDVVSDFIKGKLPKKYRKAMDNPFADLVLANAAIVAMKSLGTQNSREVDAITESMVLASMIDVTNFIDVNEVIQKVVSSVDISKITGEDK